MRFAAGFECPADVLSWQDRAASDEPPDDLTADTAGRGHQPVSSAGATGRSKGDDEETMEYLVTMTTHVPHGTPREAVDDIRRREAQHSYDLATEGQLLRLWRPPLQPGEWRTLGLFAADDSSQLEEVLASMPLRVWRTDEVTPLAPHPNDPQVLTTEAPEFLTTFIVAVPDGTSNREVIDTERREAERAHELGEQGHLLRLWKLPAKDDKSRALGLWQAKDGAEMQKLLESLPLDAWMTVETTPLARHPSDPLTANARPRQ